MKFSEQITQIRKRNHLTQQEFADKLNVTRQAVSNWENDRNLPDLEILIAITRLFNVSLDDLVLEDGTRTKMATKLIKNTSDNRKAKLNLYTILIGTFIVILGLTCIFIKANSVEYIDHAGFLHENFYLLPVGFLLIFVGVIVIIVVGLVYLWTIRHDKRK